MAIGIRRTPVTTTKNASLNPVFTLTTTVAGDTLVLFVAPKSGSTSGVTSITDNGGNTWTLVTWGALSASAGRMEVWVSENAAATTSITVHLAVSTTTSMTLYEVTGGEP